jgi:DNA polymerase-3 subunit epsilon
MGKTTEIFIDTETTGLYPEYDELLEIAIVDSKGKTLLNTLLKPIKQTEWPIAMEINDITPQMVANAPTLSEIAEQIEAIVKEKEVVIVRNCTKISLKLHKQKISNCKQAGFCELKNCIKPSFKLH